VWTLFGGRLGGVDRQLIADGRLRSLRNPEELAAFRPQRRVRPERPREGHNVLGRFIDAIDRTREEC
jgi:hypothetical protein